jgi:DNA-binding winged helix-turn-helix (wHTH) protein
VHCLDLSDGHFVVAANLNLGAQFTKILDEVISERIVVIEDEDHGFIVAVEKQGFRVSKFSRTKAKAVRSEHEIVFEPVKLETSKLETVPLLDRRAANCHAYRRFATSL